MVMNNIPPEEPREPGGQEEPNVPNTVKGPESPGVEAVIPLIPDRLGQWYHLIVMALYGPEEGRQVYREKLGRKYADIAKNLGLGYPPILIVGEGIGAAYLIRPSQVEEDEKDEERIAITIEDFHYLLAKPLVDWRQLAKEITPDDLVNTRFTMEVTDDEISVRATAPEGVINYLRRYPDLLYKMAVLGLRAMVKMKERELEKHNIPLGGFYRWNEERIDAWEALALQVTRQGEEYELEVVVK